jgi:hypothetical protein
MFWCPVSERWVIPYQGMSDQESAAIWGISVPEFLKMRADNEAFRQAYWAERGGEPTTEELDAFYAALPEDPTDYGAHGRQPAEQSRNRPSGKVRPNNQHARHGPAGEIGQG